MILHSFSYIHSHVLILSGEHEGSRRMKTELLIQMDGLARSNDLVFLLAASNLPWQVKGRDREQLLFIVMYRDLDYAMLRRLEKRILVSLPNESARVAMFKHHLPSLLTNDPVTINCHVEYDRVAQVCGHYIP